MFHLGSVYLVTFYVIIAIILMYIARRNVKRSVSFIVLLILSLLYSLVNYILFSYVTMVIDLSDNLVIFLTFVEISLNMALPIVFVLYINSAFYIVSRLEAAVAKFSAVALGFLAIGFYFVVGLDVTPSTNGRLTTSNEFQLYVFMGFISVYLVMEMFFLVKNRGKYSTSNLIKYLFIILLSIFALTCIKHLSGAFFSVVTVIGLGVSYYNIEDPAQYINHSLDVLNEKGLNKLMDGKPLKRERNFIIIKLKNIDLLSSDSFNNQSFKFIDSVVNISKSNFGFNKTFYLDHGIILVSLNNYSLYVQFKEEIKNLINERTNIDLPLTVYPIFCKIIYNEGEIVKYTELLDMVDLFDSERTRFRPFELITKDKSYYKQALKRKKILAAVKKGLKNDNFRISYQPIFDFKNKVYDGNESFIRLDDPDLGVFFARDFMHIARNNNLDKSIDKIGIEKVCKFLSDNTEKYNITYMAYNFSYDEIIDKGFLADLIYIIDRYNIAHNRIIIEISETEDINYEDLFLNNLNFLSKQDFTICVKNFGEVYSSLSNLAKYPISIMKINKELLNNSVQSSLHTDIIENIILLTNNLNIDLVLDNIDYKEDIKIIEKHSARWIQGYYYCKPLIEEKFLQFISKEGELR